MPGTLCGPQPIRLRKEGATAGQYAPNPPGYTRAAMTSTIGFDSERRRQSSKLVAVGIERCNRVEPGVRKEGEVVTR